MADLLHSLECGQVVTESGSEKSMSILADLSLDLSFLNSEEDSGSGNNEGFVVFLPYLGDLVGDKRPADDGTLDGVLGGYVKSMGDIIMLGKNESSPLTGLVDVSIVSHNALARRRPPAPISWVMAERRLRPAIPTLRRCRSMYSSRWCTHSPLTTKMNRLIIT